MKVPAVNLHRSGNGWHHLLATALALFVLTACASRKSAEHAKADAYTVWMSILKGFGEDVYYVSSSEPYAYFRIRSFLPEYYKSPSCNFILPRTFAVGAENPYVVRLENTRGYSSNPTCDPKQP